MHLRTCNACSRVPADISQCLCREIRSVPVVPPIGHVYKLSPGTVGDNSKTTTGNSLNSWQSLGPDHICSYKDQGCMYGLPRNETGVSVKLPASLRH